MIDLKFGDVITAVAWLTAFLIIISFLLALGLTPAIGAYNAFELSTFVSLIVGPIIVGYLFAPKIREENRTRTTANIAAIFAVLAMFMVLVEDAIVEWAPYYRAEYLKINSGATPTAFEWYNIQLSAVSMEVFFAVVLTLAFTFIGLYIGSQLKKPAKA